MKAIAGLLTALALFQAGGTASASIERRFHELPAPEILGPTEDASVPPEGLEFRWLMRARPDHVDFRLYKGTETIAKNRILKERVGNGRSAVRVPASTFENGATYAWSVRLVGSRKSRSVYALFTVKEGGTHAVQAA